MSTLEILTLRSAENFEGTEYYETANEAEQEVTAGTAKCGCCSLAATEFDFDRIGCGQKWFACSEHARYLDGWRRDFEYECRAETMAAAREERWAHGDDY